MPQISPMNWMFISLLSMLFIFLMKIKVNKSFVSKKIKLFKKSNKKIKLLW